MGDKLLGLDKDATLDWNEVKQSALVGWLLGTVTSGVEYSPAEFDQMVTDEIQQLANDAEQSQQAAPERPRFDQTMDALGLNQGQNAESAPEGGNTPTEAQGTVKQENEALNQVLSILTGTPTNRQAEEIVTNLEMLQAFKEVTGIDLTGTKSQQRAAVKEAAAQYEAEQKSENAAADEKETLSSNHNGNGEALNTPLQERGENGTLKTAIQMAELNAAPSEVYEATNGKYVLMANGSIRDVETGEVVYEGEAVQQKRNEENRAGREGERTTGTEVPDNDGRGTDRLDREPGRRPRFEDLTSEQRGAVNSAVETLFDGENGAELLEYAEVFGGLEPLAQQIYSDYATGDADFERWAGAIPELDYLRETFEKAADQREQNEQPDSPVNPQQNGQTSDDQPTAQSSLLEARGPEQLAEVTEGAEGVANTEAAEHRHRYAGAVYCSCEGWTCPEWRRRGRL